MNNDDAKKESNEICSNENEYHENDNIMNTTRAIAKFNNDSGSSTNHNHIIIIISSSSSSIIESLWVK